MRTPKSLTTLVEEGVIEQVIRPLMSGKEAQVYLVVSEGRSCAAKIYKDAARRSFKNRADYTEGRKVRNTRDQRAIAKGTKYGKGRDEDAWKHSEVEMIYRLRAAGVRVPEPYIYLDGVLLMELVTGAEGQPAPRLGDLEFSPQEATDIHSLLIQQATRMLVAGIVHGDLSEFNVLLAEDGPVIIDFPQSVNAAGNQNAKALFLRDIKNLFRFLRRWDPKARFRPYGEEMWELYEKNELTPETKLTGKTSRKSGPVDTSDVLSLIGEANRDEAARRRARGESTAGLGDDAPLPVRRREVIVEKPQARGRPNGTPRGRRDAASAESRGGPPGRGGPGRADQPRRGGPPRGGPPGRTDGRSGPKRGEAAKASTYVSPEARKTKVMRLSPRDGSASPNEGEEAKKNRNGNGAGATEASRSGRRRRTRRSKARGTAAGGGSSRR